MSSVAKNSITFLSRINFPSLPVNEKIKIRDIGPHQPKYINIRRSNRKFNRDWFTQVPWLTACIKKKKLFCFYCILYGGEAAWSRRGFNDLKHLSERIASHEKSQKHISNAATLSKLEIERDVADALEEQLYQETICAHNNEVTKNRYILSKFIDCIKFCSTFELILKDNEGESDKDIFSGLIDFSAQLDETLKHFLCEDAFFKSNIKAVQEKLLRCMLLVCREHINIEIKRARFLSIQVDKSDDCNNQLSIVFRYVTPSNKIVERFYGFFTPPGNDAESISKLVFGVLNSIIGNEKEKLIAQAYDGALMGNIRNDVHIKVKDIYTNAHIINCYAHRLNLTMLKATSRISDVKIFFINISGIPRFFDKSPERQEVLQAALIKLRFLDSSDILSSLDNCLIQSVYDYKDALIQCFEDILYIHSFNATTVREASSLLAQLNDEKFNYWLNLFYKIIPHVDILFTKLYEKNTCSVEFRQQFTKFKQVINTISDNIELISPSDAKKSKFIDSPIIQLAIAKNICNIILNQVQGRLSFTGIFDANKLLCGELFHIFIKKFPEQYWINTTKAFPFLNSRKLKAELMILYTRSEFRSSRGALSLLGFFKQRNLLELFSEITTLIKVLITTPTHTDEPGRCFPTLEIITHFLKTITFHEHQSALAMITIEKQLITTIPDFNEKVINKYAELGGGY